MRQQASPFQQYNKTDMDGILLISTESEKVLSNKPFDVSALQPCNNAEADTSIILHLAHASSQGHDKAFVRTVDSDIVVLAIAFYEQLGLSELWIGFGSGKSDRDIPVHSIYAQLGPSKSLALPICHALTCCDTTSELLGCRTKTAWTAWNSTPALRDTMITLTEPPESFTMESVHMQCIERFVVLMYSKTCGSATMVSTIYSQMEVVPLTVFRQPRQHSSNMLRGLCSKLVLSGSSQSLVTKKSLSLINVDWNRISTSSNGAQSGPPWLTQARLVPSSCIVDAQKHGGGIVNAAGRTGLRCPPLCKCEGGCLNNDDINANH